MASIELFITGGTISKVYNELNGELFCNEQHINDMLTQARVKVDIKVTTLMLKDSLEMDDDDRQKIYQSCKDSKSSKIIITHGTDTMVDTAKKLSSIQDKLIVLTGAMIPYAFKNSDALFNMGVTFGAVDVLDKGVYICMNGQIFAWDSVEKNRQKGMFETK
jgi:L-asparaginase